MGSTFQEQTFYLILSRVKCNEKRLSLVMLLLEGISYILRCIPQDCGEISCRVSYYVDVFYFKNKLAYFSTTAMRS